MDKLNDYEKAKRIVEAKLAFFIHLGVYICVNIMLVIINLNTDPSVLWFKWPLMGWGIGLVIHGLNTFIHGKLDKIKERMIENEMEKTGK